MATQFSAVIRRNGIPALAVQIGSRSRQVVDDTGQAIRDLAAVLAPRDTGSLQESFYIGNGETSDYALRAGAARSRNRSAVIVPEVLPEFALTLSGEGGGYTVVVGSAVQHALFQEFGTRFQSAQPSLIPAVEANREAFVAAMGHVADA